MKTHQLLNKEKTIIFFRLNTLEEVRTTITNIFGIKTHGGLEKYLGLPILIRQNKSKYFQFLLDKIWSKMSNWKTKFLSGAGKEILLKAVLQAISTYTMSMFLPPKVIISQLNSLFQKLWWGYNSNLSKTHWAKWSKLGLSKEKGGIVFKNVQEFHLDLLANNVGE